MKFELSRFVPSLPLLGKELVEQSARKRTYVARSIYALLLFLVVLLFLWQEVFRRDLTPLNMRGEGRQIFEMIAGLQIFGIYAFLPAMLSGTITHEKERDSLQLLIITDLRPWQIVVQKLLGRMIPMIYFMLLSLPLLAVA